MRINGLESDNWRVERDDCGQLVIVGLGRVSLDCKNALDKWTSTYQEGVGEHSDA